MTLNLTKDEAKLLKLLVGTLCEMDSRSDAFMQDTCYDELGQRLTCGNPYRALTSLERKLLKVE